MFIEIDSEKRREYYENFVSKNKDKINIKCFCEVCGGRYTYYNKSSHNKTKKHQFKLMENELYNLQKNL